ncbi:MFS transporter [Tardiphaga sp. 1201_B9_N1_1]|uniref:MFS transporter n=1 Tax=unclassified Tardiphaga TaxID=2631404 RepID=UPI003F242D8F
MASLTAVPLSTEADQVVHPSWSGIYAMAVCVAVLIASEFMPVSLLSPIAADLGLTEGQAGQAIAISGVLAVITSFSIASIAGKFDRKWVLLALSSLLIVSGVMVASAPTFAILMAGRALLGIAIGGFWSMSTATIMRLVPAASLPRGLAIVYGGNALAAAVSAPLGSLLGGIIGWRFTFLSVVPLAVIAVVWQAITLPKMPAVDRVDTGGALRVLGNRNVVLGLFAVAMLFLGQFSLFTYLRPFLEQVTGATVSMLSAMLLVVGIAGFIGTSFIGRVIGNRLRALLAVIPLIMAATAIALGVFGKSSIVTALLLAVWGLVSTAAPVVWSTWLSRTLPQDAEIGGGLMVGTIQLAITIGAAVGGIVFDARGPVVDFVGSGFVLVIAAIVAFVGVRDAAARPQGA